MLVCFCKNTIKGWNEMTYRRKITGRTGLILHYYDHVVCWFFKFLFYKYQSKILKYR